MDAPLILTLRLDPASFARLNGLRQAHFPPARNVVPAHITLFHALPAAHQAVVQTDLHAEAQALSPFALAFPTVRFLGRGVAVTVDAPELLALRGRLAQRWRPWLSNQDRQPYRPHVTIQNKVDADTARALFTQLQSSWEPLLGQALGLELWVYLGGPWELHSQFPFAGGRFTGA
jgi:2'-5' RNA ligase